MTQFRNLVKMIPTILLALVLAIAVWVFAVVESDPMEERVFPRLVTIEVTGKNDNLIITSEIPSQLYLTLKAPRSIWDRLLSEPGLVRAYTDISLLGSGKHIVPVNIQLGIEPVEIVMYNPRSFEMTIENDVTREFSVNLIQRGQPAVGFQAEKPTLDFSTIIVRGPESKVNRVQEVRAILDLNQATSKINRTLKLQAMDATGATIDGVSLNPDQVVVTQGITQLGGYRNLAVKVVVKGQIASGYRLTNIQAFPAAVTVYSNDPGLINQLPGYVETVALNVSDAKEDMDVRVSLSLPAGVSAVGDQTVQVVVGIDAIETSLTFNNMAVEVVGLGEGLSATVSPESVDVILSGPVPLLDQLTSDQLRVVVDMNGVDAGTYQRVPEVEISVKDVRVESILPKTVELEVGMGKGVRKATGTPAQKDIGKEAAPTVIPDRPPVEKSDG